MNRTIRAVRADPLRAGCLFAVTVAVATGAGCVVAYGPQPTTGAPMVAILSGNAATGVLATAVLVAGGLRSRAQDIAVAVVRGMSAARTWRWLSAEPLVVSAAGMITALPVSVLAWRLLEATGRGAPDQRALALLAAVAGGACCLLTAVVCCALAPIGRSTSGRRRTPVWLAAVEVAAVVGAAGLLYQAAVAGPGEHSVLVSFAPVSAALAAVVTARRLTGGVGRLGMVIWSRTRDLSRFLAARRLRRTTASAVSLAALAGALVLGVYAGVTRNAEGAWRAEVADVETGGVTAYSSDRSATATFLASRTADPDGRWLMTIVATAQDSDPGDYRGYADLARWPRVIGDRWGAAGTDADAVERGFGDDSWNPVTVSGGSVRIRAHNELHWPGGERAFLNLSLLQPNGDIVTVPVRIGEPGQSVLTGQVDGCAEACTLRKITIGTRADAPINVRGGIVLHAIESSGHGTGWVAGDDRAWAPDLRTASHEGAIGVRAEPDGLELRPNAAGLPDPVGVVPSRAHLERRVLAAGHTHVGARALGLDSTVAPASVASRFPVLPLVGAHGYLGNLPDVVLDSFDEPAGSRVRVLARDDTPAGVLEALSRAGVSVDDPVTAGDVVTELGRSQHSRAALAWSMLAMVAAVAGVAVAVHSEVSARTGTRRDGASLRVAHVPAREATRTVSYEVALVSLASLLPAGLLGLITWWCVRDATVLAAPAPFEPTVDLSLPWLPIVIVTVATFVVSGSCVLALRHRDTARGRPEILRTTGTTW